MPALLFLSLIASSAGAQDGAADFVVGKSTKGEVLARFGPAAHATERAWAYYAHEIGPPPYPAWLRDLVLSRRQLMVIFRFDERDVFVGHTTTGWPSP